MEQRSVAEQLIDCPGWEWEPGMPCLTQNKRVVPDLTHKSFTGYFIKQLVECGYPGIFFRNDDDLFSVRIDNDMGSRRYTGSDFNTLLALALIDVCSNEETLGG